MVPVWMFEKKYSGYGGERLCSLCAVRQQRRKYSERLEYMLKQIDQFPKSIEPLRDLVGECDLAELLIASDKPLSASRSKEMTRARARHALDSGTAILNQREEHVGRARELIVKLKQG